MLDTILKDKLVIVTGGASGIGYGLVCEALARGAGHVIIVDLNADALASAVARIADERVSSYQIDVSSESAVAEMVATAEAKHGGTGLYISNAGVLFADRPDFTIFAQDAAAWQTSWDVNVMAHLHACRAVLPGMIERGAGGFLITASAAGLLSQMGAASYSTTKHAAVGFAESLAISHGDDGIYVGALCPQAVESNMSKGAEQSTAAADGILPADMVAKHTFDAMAEGRFMIRPHTNVEQYFQHKAQDYDRWVGTMRKIRRAQIARTGEPL